MAVGAVTVLLALSVGACADDDEPGTAVVTETATQTVTPSSAAAPPAASSPTTSDGECVDQGMNPANWNTAEDTAPPISPATDGGIGDVTPSAGECFDQIVISTTTSEVGFDARYVPQVRQDGSGFPVQLQGGAFLELSVFAWVNDPQQFRDYRFVADDSYRTLREIAFATSFEGVTKFGIGVDEETPFAVEKRRRDDGIVDVVVFLAH
ncbi:hypothetical protein VZC37_15965 [Gordonia sp. LSe1-13]|uniref:AMIN-like domain-containing protein n=1 Tax=Gordonia sesuvii TaxID=3116777 RepID=A0ABU7MFN5_9ACTN|nr:hypothetical protein [Gordonia sp. LSe1-13]